MRQQRMFCYATVYIQRKEHASLHAVTMKTRKCELLIQS